MPMDKIGNRRSRFRRISTLGISSEAETKNHLVEELVGPRAIPRARPIGCARKSVVPAWFRPNQEAVSDQDAWNSADAVSSGHASTEDHIQEWPALYHAVGNELCRLHDLVNTEGFARTKTEAEEGE